MSNTQHHTNGSSDAPSPEGVLSPEERSERDLHVEAVRAAQGNEFEAQLEQGRHLRAINHRRLYRDGGLSFEAFCQARFEFTGGRAYQLIKLADACDELVAAGEEPLDRASHAEALYPVIGTEALVPVVRRARAAADDEGVALAARHLVAARGDAADLVGGTDNSEVDTVPGGPEEAQEWSEDARSRFVRVPVVDRDAVYEALQWASLSEEITAETVDEAAAVVAARRAEDGRSGGSVVIGKARAIVEENRRSLLGETRHVQADIGYIDDAPRHPLLVVIPQALCPEALLDAYAGARERARRATELIVELSELERYGGPVENGVLDLDAVRRASREARIRKAFNPTGPLVGWNRFSTNPFTGCSHGCSRLFCYASDLALKFYPQAFVPTIHPARLDAFNNTTLPDDGAVCPHAPGWDRSVFLGSMGDIMNVSFPDWWIQAVINEVAAHPEWNVFFLTKLAHRLADFEWPSNAAVGVTVTRGREVRAAAAGLASVRGGAFRWVSVEPFLDAVDPTKLLEAGATFFAVGGRSRTRWADEFQPSPAWVKALVRAVWEQGGEVYIKGNLCFRGHIPFRSHSS